MPLPIQDMDQLKNTGLKVTVPRMKILEVFQRSTQRHLTAEEVFRHLLDDNADIGLATVYRVLTQFEQAGLLLRNHFEGGKAVYRPTCHYAYHPCDSAVLSIHELAGKNWRQQHEQRDREQEVAGVGRHQRHHQPRLRRDAVASSKGEGGGGDGEVEEPVRLGEQRLNVGGDRHAVPAQPGELARVAADDRRGGRLHRAGQDCSVRGRNSMDERAPHASAGPSHDQPHVGHGISPANLAAGIARQGCEGK